MLNWQMNDFMNKTVPDDGLNYCIVARKRNKTEYVKARYATLEEAEAKLEILLKTSDPMIYHRIEKR